MNGYRHIPTIGTLFIIQVITGFLLATAVLILRSPLVMLGAAGFLLSTIGGFLLSVWIGLFKFKEMWSSPYAGLAFTVEVIGVVVLLGGAYHTRRSSHT
jgi:hypothetical protein